MSAVIEVRGDSVIKHVIDDEVVLQYEKPVLDEQSPDYQKLLSPETGKRLTRGHISLQAESHPTDFRMVEIMILEEDESSREKYQAHLTIRKIGFVKFFPDLHCLNLFKKRSNWRFLAGPK